MEQKNFLELINKIIDDRTRYLRTYSGKVANVTDSENKGRILVTIPELGWKTNDTGAWCYATQDNALVTPKIGDWVRVGFLAGKPERPYYMGIMSEIEAMNPTNYESSDTQIIFESNNNAMYIKYNENTKASSIVDGNGNEIQLSITATDLVNSLLHLGSATAAEQFVLGTTFNAFVTAIITAFNTHNHPTAPVGALSTPSTTFPPAGAYLSNKIYGE